MNITIQKYQSGQEEHIYNLIRKVYDEFVAPDYTTQGNQVFYDWIEPSKMALRQADEINLWVAFVEKRMAGMIELRDHQYVSLLFVDKVYHQMGIARKLLHEALADLLKRFPATKTILVHASPYSVEAYRNLGFIDTDSKQEKFGIRYLPMEKKL